MPFRRYVEIGRVAMVNLAEDPLYGKLVVIVDVLDHNRVRAVSGVVRARGGGGARAAGWRRRGHLRLRLAGSPGAAGGAPP